MKLLLFSINSNTQAIDVNPNQKVSDLMNAIKAKTQVPVQRQRITFKNMLLDSTKKIQDYKMVERDQLFLTISEPGGVQLINFQFNGLSSDLKKSKTFTPTAPKYRIVFPGLNLEGVCDNKNCQAYLKNVLIPKQFGIFNMAKEILTSVCPLCKQKAKKINNINYWKTIIHVQGQMEKEDQQESQQIFQFNDKSESDKESVTFRNMDSDQRKWMWMEITTTKLS